MTSVTRFGMGFSALIPAIASVALLGGCAGGLGDLHWYGGDVFGVTSGDDSTPSRIDCPGTTEQRFACFSEKLRQRARSTSGAFVVVGQDGRSFHTTTREPGQRAPTSVDTLFPLASITKMFTAATAVRLSQEGVLELNRPISSYIPEIGTRTELGRVTVHQLLTHTAGLLDPVDQPLCAGNGELSATVAKAHMAAPPGAVFLYSNTGYSLAGVVIERATGSRFEDVVRERVLRPMGMAGTTFDGGALRVRGHATGATPRRCRAMYPAGGLIASARDLARWAQAMTNPDTHPLGRKLVDAPHAKSVPSKTQYSPSEVTQPASVGALVSRADVDDGARERIGECLARGETDQARILVVWPAGIGGADAILDAAIRVSKGYTAVQAVDAPAVRDVLRDTLAVLCQVPFGPQQRQEVDERLPVDLAFADVRPPRYAVALEGVAHRRVACIRVDHTPVACCFTPLDPGATPFDGVAPAERFVELDVAIGVRGPFFEAKTGRYVAGSPIEGFYAVRNQAFLAGTTGTSEVDGCGALRRPDPFVPATGDCLLVGVNGHALLAHGDLLVGRGVDGVRLPRRAVETAAGVLFEQRAICLAAGDSIHRRARDRAFGVHRKCDAVRALRDPQGERDLRR
jgi:CubicO group peptidase (beta-lactamase class C family)